MLSQDPQPLSQAAHGDLGLLPETGYAFAGAVTEVPVYAYELRRLVPVLPLVIDVAVRPATVRGLTGLAPGENLLVGPRGGWGGAVVPEALRDHPFEVRVMEEGRGVLYLDAASERLTREGGMPLFTADGAPGEPVAAQQRRLAERIRDRVATDRAIAALEEAGVLAPWSATDCPALDSARHRYAEPNRIAELDDATRLHLLDCGALALAYAQAHSRTNLDKLRRLRQRRGVSPDVAEALGELKDDGALDFSQI